MKVEIATVEENIEKIIDAIQNAARTGEIGDGKIFIYPIAEAIKVRTGERGVSVL